MMRSTSPEIRVARRIDDVDAVTVPLERGVLARMVIPFSAQDHESIIRSSTFLLRGKVPTGAAMIHERGLAVSTCA